MEIGQRTVTAVIGDSMGGGESERRAWKDARHLCGFA